MGMSMGGGGGGSFPPPMMNNDGPRTLPPGMNPERCVSIGAYHCKHLLTNPQSKSARSGMKGICSARLVQQLSTRFLDLLLFEPASR